LESAGIWGWSSSEAAAEAADAGGGAGLAESLSGCVETLGSGFKAGLTLGFDAAGVRRAWGRAGREGPSGRVLLLPAGSGLREVPRAGPGLLAQVFPCFPTAPSQPLLRESRMLGEGLATSRADGCSASPACRVRPRLWLKKGFFWHLIGICCVAACGRCPL